MIAIKTKVAIAMGDGIGPEIMQATLRMMEAAGSDLDPQFIRMGEQVYKDGNSAGIDPQAWETLRDTRVLLKAPITTPQGGGYKSLNVTLRKTLSLFSNVRPVRALYPYVQTHFPEMDLVIIRENEEDLYAGIEHQQTEDVVQCLKLITRPGCERIVRYAFEYAKVNNRKRVTCMTKDNIMKLTDGLFHRVFNEIAEEYPEIVSDHMIIDIGAARLAASPDEFDVVVTPNLYGDIVSDIVSQVAGSVGLSGSSNIGPNFAMFEAIHGSAPDIAGKDIANPSGLLNAAIMMLRHLGKLRIAQRLEDAWLQAIEEGIHTKDIFREGKSTRCVGTSEFADAVIARLKPMDAYVNLSDASTEQKIEIPQYNRRKHSKEIVGTDVFICWEGNDPEVLGERLSHVAGDHLKLKMITNRGVKVYPDPHPETFCTDHWRCRFVSESASTEGEKKFYSQIEYEDILILLGRLNDAGLEVIKTENLYKFDGERAFSLGQGE